MIDSLEDELRDVFGTRAAAPVDTDALAHGAQRQGRRRRVLVHGARGITATALAAVMALALLPGEGPGIMPAGPPPPADDFPPALDGGAPGWGPVPDLPAAIGAPTGAAAVGTDPGVLHFTLDTGPDSTGAAVWRTGGGLESLELIGPDGSRTSVGLAHDPARLDGFFAERAGLGWAGVRKEPRQIGGRPAEGFAGDGVYSLRWQPAGNLWAQVYLVMVDGTRTDLDAVARIPGFLRLDTARRCASPIRLGYRPPGTGITGCSVTLTGYDFRDTAGRPSRVLRSVIEVGAGREQVIVQLESFRPVVPISSLSLDPPGPAKYYVHAAEVDGVYAAVHSFGDNVDEQQAIATGLTWQGDGRDPATWPERLAG
ncbi:hypothetical protein Dvina_40100 [Dactylosporangium vinaceum]|uniref:LigA protein n=1 Tax=Dactylosporangium vinaceum TaxID=53362 RepID=A0ABV5M817_9ACTN|nr:hypothetical protein [Dactylosporangium vinaceum]UAB94306.1 hypothetical protein Dvina_40100 [Dactylosporangium vinaceum]